MQLYQVPCNFFLLVRFKRFSSRQVLLIIVNTMHRGRDISNSLRGAIVAADQFGEVYKINSKQFGVVCSTVTKILQKWKEKYKNPKSCIK